MRAKIAVTLLLIGIWPASASVYNLSPSLAGSEVVGPIAGAVPVALGVTLSGPVPTNPFPGFSVLAYDVYFAKVDGNIGMTIFSGPSGGNGIVTGGGNAVVTDAARFLLFGSGLSHSSGDTLGFPFPIFTITLPDELSLLSSSGLIIAPIASGIPEAPTWTMMIFGFAGISFCLCRNARKNRASAYAGSPGGKPATHTRPSAHPSA
jgi:hypothetical protein